MRKVYLVLLLILGGCSTGEREIDISSIKWVQDFGYNTEEVFLFKVSGRIPGPQIPVYINGEKLYMLVDPLFDYMVIKESKIKGIDFEPQRINTEMFLGSEMMFEEGFVHNVKFLNKEYSDLYILALKKSDLPFRPDGIVGKNFFSNSILAIDYQNRLLGVKEGPLNFPNGIPERYKIIKFYMDFTSPGYTSCLKFNGSIDGMNSVITISTFFSISTISPEMVKSIAGGRIPSTYTIDTLRVGNQTFTEIKCIVEEKQLDIDPEGRDLVHLTLGVDFIKDKVLIFSPADSLLLLGQAEK